MLLYIAKCTDKKEGIWPSPMTKAPTPTEMSKGQSDNADNATKKFDKTAIADRLRTVSWSNYSHPTGVVYQVYRAQPSHSPQQLCNRGQEHENITIQWHWISKDITFKTFKGFYIEVKSFFYAETCLYYNFLIFFSNFNTSLSLYLV